MAQTGEVFGAWLVQQRKKADLTQETLAERARLTKSYISNLERNQPHTVSGALPRPSVEAVDAIAHALGVPVNEARLYAGYAPKESDVSPENERLLGYYRRLSKRDKEIVLDLIGEKRGE